MILKLLLEILIVAELIFQVQCQSEELDSSQTCGSGFRCTPTYQCREDALNSIRGKHQECISKPPWRRHICCPVLCTRRGQSSVQTHCSTVTSSTTSTTSIPKFVQLHTNPGTTSTRSTRTTSTTTTTTTTTTIAPTTAAHFVNENSMHGCGVAGPVTNEQISEGTSERGSWPWMVSFKQRSNKSYWCSGILVTKRNVISAAHCFLNPISQYAAIIGHVDKRMGQEYHIRSIAVHSGFVPGKNYDDIAIVTLTKEVPSTTAICLPNSALYQNLIGTDITVVGWGGTKNNGCVEPHLFLQQQPSWKVMSNFACNRMLRNTHGRDRFQSLFPHGIDEKYICVDSGDSCKISPGSALMVSKSERWFAVGMITFSSSNEPTGSIRLSEYLDWIQDNIKD